MTPIIEDAVLGSDLDGGFYSLLNVKSLDPVPPNLATSDDVRLTDVREPIPGSVTNASVADDAAIDQSKLALNGQIPAAWLGTTAGTAAPGDLAEYLSNKNQPNGYAGLDATGKIPSASLPDSVGLATVTSVGLTMPPQFNVSGSPVTNSGTLGVTWLPMGGAAWFGALAAGPPAYQTVPIPASLVPPLNTSQVTSGTFAPARFPVFIGVGGTHAIGAVPDPGAAGAGLATDYLGRDANWHTAPTIAVGYQPTLPTPSVSTQMDGTNVKVFAGSTVGNVTFFYSLTSATALDFAEFPNPGYVVITPSDETVGIWIYSSRVGWNNSAMFHKAHPIFP